MPEETNSVVETSADTAPVETTTQDPAPDVQDAAPETDASTQDAQPTQEEPAKVEFSDKQAKDFDRMSKALANLQAENARLKETAKPAASKSEAKSDTDTHPALKGLKADDDGEYAVNGKYYTKDELIERYETNTKLRELEERLNSKETAEQEAKARADYEREQQKFNDSLVSTLKDFRSKFLPDVPADMTTKVDRNIRYAFDEIMQSKIDLGEEFSAALIQSAMTDAIEEARGLYSYFGTKQIQDNLTHKSTNPVKPGTPGAKQYVDPIGLSEKDAKPFIERAMEAVRKSKSSG